MPFLRRRPAQPAEPATPQPLPCLDCNGVGDKPVRKLNPTNCRYEDTTERCGDCNGVGEIRY